MTLAPKLPPGRANRKALQFTVDIHRLRNAGYTFSAIRMALLDAGISVSLSTIKREATRKETSTLRAQQLGLTSTTELGTDRLGGTTAQLPVPTGSSGREIAEAFFNAHPSNPLFPTKDAS
jgi:hypothetical protein